MEDDLRILAYSLGITTTRPQHPVDGQMFINNIGNIVIRVDDKWQVLENAKTTMEYMALQQLKAIKNFEVQPLQSRFQQVAEEL